MPDADEISADFLAALPDSIQQEVLAQHRLDRIRRRGLLDVPAVGAAAAAATTTTTMRRNQRRLLAGSGSGSGSGGGALQQGQQQQQQQQQRRVLRLPPRAPKATFTTQRLSSLPELRGAVAGWVAGFAGDGDDGPYAEDVAALAKYLGRVVREGREMHKAVALVKWLAWVVDDYRVVAVLPAAATAAGKEEKEEKGEAEAEGEAAVPPKVMTQPAKDGWLRALKTVSDAVQAAVRERGLGPVDFSA